MTTATKLEGLAGSSYEVPAPSAVDREHVLEALDEIACRRAKRTAATPALEDIRAGRVRTFASTEDFLTSLDF